MKDRYEVWECKTPFKRVTFLAFKNALNEAESNCGGEGYVTLKALAAQLTTKAWAGLDDENSELAKLLLSDAFKDPSKGQSAEQIDKDFLMMFGLLHCVDNAKHPMEKAKGFYEVLQEGGFERHKQISAGDKDFKPAFLKMCNLVTAELFEFSTVKKVYDEAQVDELKGIMEENIMEAWLEDVYDVKSSLVNDAWLQKVTNEAKWVFDAVALRGRIFKEAGVDVKHIAA